MRSILSFLFIIPLIFSSCKKGEHDPFISLKSRNKRMENTWVLKDLEMTYVDQSSPNPATTTVYTYDGSSLYRNGTFEGKYGLTLTIKKDGTYQYFIDLEGEEYDRLITSIWSWSNTTKKKSQVHLYEFDFYNGEENLDIDRLTGKELILKYHTLGSNQFGTESEELKMTFEKK